MFIKEMAIVTHAKPCGTFSFVTASSGIGKDTMTYIKGIDCPNRGGPRRVRQARYLLC